MSSRCALGLFVLLAACQAAPEDYVPGEVGIATDVEVLDAGFVRFEGERMALEFFLLEMRDRVRAHWGDPENLPVVRVELRHEVPGIDARWVSSLREELYKAGVPRIVLTSP